MSRSHRHSPEFRRRILELVRMGKKPAELAKEYEVPLRTVQYWIQQDLRGEAPKRQPTDAELRELERLRKRVKELEEEREILKKAAAWFARESVSIPPRRTDS